MRYISFAIFSNSVKNSSFSHEIFPMQSGWSEYFTLSEYGESIKTKSTDSSSKGILRASFRIIFNLFSNPFPIWMIVIKK